MAFSYGEENRFADQIINASMTSAGTYGPAHAGAVNGGVAVVLTAGSSGCSVSTGSLTLQFPTCATESGAYTSSNLDTVTLGKTSYTSGAEIFRYVLPGGVAYSGADEYVKVTLGKSVASGTISGSMAASLQYLPR